MMTLWQNSMLIAILPLSVRPRDVPNHIDDSRRSQSCFLEEDFVPSNPFSVNWIGGFPFI